jgi:D-alanyl-D-alanine carboxypeptidase/D-alanyl-D-alanine-endopeptidase (penicillin-binding protein 4)
MRSFPSVAICLLPALAASAADLPGRVAAVLAESPISGQATVGIHVVDLKTSQVKFALNENRWFLPASNMKLFTSALALNRLGRDYRFETRLVREPSGDLVLIGAGDPSLSGRAYPYRKNGGNGSALGAIEQIADQAVAAGLHSVEGDIAGDDRLYPWSPYPPSWTEDDILSGFGAPVSALSVADNTITLTMRAGERAGDPAVVSLDPPLEYFAIDNRIVTGTGPTEVRVSRWPGSRQLLLSGNIRIRNGELQRVVPVDDPALYAACALYDALVRRGVTIRGRPVARHRSPGEPFVTVAGDALATRTSPPLAELLQMMDKVSQNLHAELLLREAGRVSGGEGTQEIGLRQLANMLVEMGAAPEQFRLEDASGLARNTQVSPRLVTRLLSAMHSSPHRDVWMSLLPVGGEDGTLERRLCCMRETQSIQAKTGTLARSVALSGYADSRANGRLAFSILVNNFSAPASEVQAWVDKIALALVE